MLNAAVLGAGFIGKNFIKLALSLGYTLKVLDHKACPAVFRNHLTWVQGDFRDEQSVVKLICGMEVVFHFISSTIPGELFDESDELIQNVVQTIQLLKICIRNNVKRIVFISSSSVYGVQNDLPILETASTDPISSHGIHKLMIEKYLRLYQYQHGLDCKIIRLSNPYGPMQDIYGKQGFIALLIGRILEKKAIMIRGDGSTVRDFIHIDDVVEIIHLAATTQSPEIIFNVGSGQGYSLNQIIKKVEKIIHKTLEVNYQNNCFTDIPQSVLDINRVRCELNKVDFVSIEDGLTKILAFHGVHKSLFCV